MLLSTLIFFPLVAALFCFLIAALPKSLRLGCIIPYLAMAFSIIELAIAFSLWYQFDSSIANMQFVESYKLGQFLSIGYKVGVDGLSIFFVLLTTILIPICIAISWDSIKEQKVLYYSLFLLLEGLVVGVFCILDLVIFYIFFEAVLIPMFFIIGIWGGENRVYASLKFFIYTLFGSVFMLLAILFIILATNTADIVELSQIKSSYLPNLSITDHLLWFGFFLAFAVKIPMFPFHTWLPDAHVQAPTAGSVILAGILLKIGGYGFIRVLLPIFPEVSRYYSSFVIILSIIAILYASLVALMQSDMKKMIAYSSVAHMGYVTAGIFTLSNNGIEGAIIQMISHGLISSALFIGVGVLYNRMHTKEISFYSGLTEKMPVFAFWLMVFTLGSVALPGTSGFVGEFVILMSLFEVELFYGIAAALGMVLGAAYMLWLYARIMFNKLSPNLANINDLVLVERLAFISLGFLVLLFGLYPSIITNYTKVAVKLLLTNLTL